MARSSSAGDELRRLLDRIRSGALDAKRALEDFDPALLRELLLPAIRDAPGQALGLARWTGGICGSPGAVAGRAYFSSAALLEALRQDRQNRERPVLVLPAVFAGDVPALKASGGVLTSAGGYGSHASVVARQYGKVSLVAPELRMDGKTAMLGDLRFCEGDFITLDARPEGSTVCLGAAELRAPEPGPELGEFIALAKGLVKNFQIRANADTPEEAEQALSLGAEGIGLCRTEHMFFREGRINSLRALLLSESAPERERVLKTLLPMQRDDFYRIFKIMAGKPVTVRLLDAPLHEFMPRNDAELQDYLDHCSRSTGKLCSRDDVLDRIAMLREENPMLGFRGCRVAVSHPEIYAVQVRAIFEAALQLGEEGIDVQPEILIPLVMNAAELRLIAYGKQAGGASYPGLEDGFRNETGMTPPPHSIGAMVELPAAALDAGDIARYARFLSFGTNDLTQTALGLSRDDSAAFLNAYSHYDLLGADPFSVLDSRVKELASLAVSRGRLTRPDLVCGLCGEQAADPETIRFCMDLGLDYISCSPLAVPQAILAAAQAATLLQRDRRIKPL